VGISTIPLPLRNEYRSPCEDLPNSFPGRGLKIDWGTPPVPLLRLRSGQATEGVAPFCTSCRNQRWGGSSMREEIRIAILDMCGLRLALYPHPFDKLRAGPNPLPQERDAYSCIRLLVRQILPRGYGVNTHFALRYKYRSPLRGQNDNRTRSKYTLRQAPRRYGVRARGERCGKSGILMRIWNWAQDGRRLDTRQTFAFYTHPFDKLPKNMGLSTL